MHFYLSIQYSAEAYTMLGSTLPHTAMACTIAKLCSIHCWTCLQQWTLHFNSYMTILAMKEPHWIGDLLAYSSMIINTSSEYRLLYDATTDPSRLWAAIYADDMLFATRP